MKLIHPTKQFKNLVLNLPTSKSINNRVLIIRSLSGEKFEIFNPSNSVDSTILTNILNSNPLDAELDIQAAGTCMRFLTSYLNTVEGEYVLTGTERMKQRPIKILVDALRQLGAEIEYVGNEGFPPIKIKGGQLNGGATTIAGNVSSQYISSLLMVAPYMKLGLELEIDGELLSEPYVNMTLNLLNYFGVQYTREANKFIIKPQSYQAKDIAIEPDWSGVSYFYSLVSSSEDAEIYLTNFASDSLQGDSVVKEIYSQLGVQTEFDAKGMTLSKMECLLPKFFHYDFSECPDIAQTVAVSLCQLEVPFKLSGLKTLRIKETDRIEALRAELNKLGYKVYVDLQDNLCWDGEMKFVDQEVSIHTYDDHRMAMSFAPMSLKHDINIEEPQVVEKSYPDFWKDMKKMGFEIK